MAIQGYTDIASIQHRALPVPVLAMVKKGDVKPDRGAGRNLSYFRFAWEDKRAETIFNAAFGDSQLREIPITVLSDEVDAVLDSAYRKYLGNNTLDKKCDGHEISFSLNPELSHTPCNCDAAKRDSADANIAKAFCQPKAYFHFTIPELCRDLGYLGKFILLTGSLYEMRDMATILNSVKQGTGKLIGQPFLLRRSEKHYDVMLNGKPSRLTQYNVELIPPIQLVLSRIENPLIAAPDLPQLQTGEYFEDESPNPLELDTHLGKQEVSEQWNDTQLKHLTMPLYKNPFHHDNGIKAAFDNQEINYDMTLQEAVAAIFAHRAASEHGLTKDELEAVMGGEVTPLIVLEQVAIRELWNNLRKAKAEFPA